MSVPRLLLVPALLMQGELLGQTAPQFLAQLEKAQNQWETAALPSYSYQITSGGAFGGTTHRITVRDGECRARSKSIRKSSRWRRAACSRNTIDEVFAQLRMELLPGDLVVTSMDFDPAFGFPTRFSLDSTLIEDQLWYVEISDFTTQTSRRE